MAIWHRRTPFFVTENLSCLVYIIQFTRQTNILKWSTLLKVKFLSWETNETGYSKCLPLALRLLFVRSFFFRVTCFKTWQSPMPSSITWSAKMTVCAYPCIISLAPKKITVSSTLLIKTEASGDEVEARRKLLWFGEKLHGEGEIKLFV